MRIQTVVRAISQTCELDKGYTPLYQAPEKYLKPLELIRENKLPVPQIAVPTVVPQQMALVGMATDATAKE